MPICANKSCSYTMNIEFIYLYIRAHYGQMFIIFNVLGFDEYIKFYV